MDDNIITLSNDYEHLEEIISNYFGLKLGGHKLQITDICKHINPINNNISIKVCFDMADGDENDGCFKKEYESKFKKYTNVYWPVEGTKYLSLNPRYELYMKNFIKAVKKSNDVEINDIAGKDLDLSQFIGLYVGGEFGLEESTREGITTARFSLFNFKAIEDLPYIREARVKLDTGVYQSYDLYLKEHEFTEEDSALNEDMSPTIKVVKPEEIDLEELDYNF